VCLCLPRLPKPAFEIFEASGLSFFSLAGDHHHLLPSLEAA
jgi:hypothetical protein